MTEWIELDHILGEILELRVKSGMNEVIRKWKKWESYLDSNGCGFKPSLTIPTKRQLYGKFKNVLSGIRL